MIWLKTPKTLPTILNSIQSCPDGTRITLSGPKRTTEQNRLFWSLLGQLETRATYHGLKLSKEDWRTIFVSGLKRELRVVPSLDSAGFVPLGYSSSALSVAEMGDAILLIEAWAAQHEVTLTRTMPGYEE